MSPSQPKHATSPRKHRGDVQLEHALELEAYLPYRVFNLTAKLAFQGKWPVNGVDVSVRDWRILAYLAARGPSSNSELADDMGVDAATISRAIQFLRDQGLVQVRRSTRDRRTQIVALTQKGADVHDVIAPQRKRFSDEVEACLTQPERANLFAALDKIDAYFAARESEDTTWE